MLFGFSYFDIGAAFVFFIALIVGLKRGLIKMVFGLLSSVAALVIAIMLVMPATSFIVEATPIDDLMVNAIEKPLASNYPILDSQLLYFNHDADPETPDILGFYYNETIHPLEDVLSQSSLLSFFSDDIIKYAANFMPEGGGSFLRAFVSFIVAYALIPLTFIFIWIFAAVIFTIVSAILTKMVESFKIISLVDKLGGVVLSFVLAVVFLVIVVTGFDLLAGVEAMAGIKESVINNSIVGALIDEFNPLSDYIKSIDFKSMINELISKIGVNI